MPKDNKYIEKILEKPISRRDILTTSAKNLVGLTLTAAVPSVILSACTHNSKNYNEYLQQQSDLRNEVRNMNFENILVFPEHDVAILEKKYCEIYFDWENEEYKHIGKKQLGKNPTLEHARNLVCDIRKLDDGEQDWKGDKCTGFNVERFMVGDTNIEGNYIITPVFGDSEKKKANYSLDWGKDKETNEIIPAIEFRTKEKLFQSGDNGDSGSAGEDDGGVSGGSSSSSGEK